MKKILRITSSGVLTIMFMLMFFQMNFISIVEIMASKRPNSDQDFTEYYLPSGERISIGRCETKSLVVPFVMSISPADSFMWDVFPDGKFRQKCLPNKHQLVIKLKKVDEFKKEQLTIVPLVSLSKKNYFGSMSYVGECVDKIISNQSLMASAQILYGQRKGTARLRPFISYLAYDLAGGLNQDTAEKLATISETTNLHLYSHNYLIDDKNLKIQDDRILTLLSGGQYFSNLTTKLVCELEIPDTNKVAILNRLAQEIDLTYLGQITDVNLNVNNYPKEENDYLLAYEERSTLMSGPMYGFSFWLSYVAAGNLNLADHAYTTGKNLGLTLQLINDIADYSSKKSDAFSDLRFGKMTAPLYYLKKYHGEERFAAMNAETLSSLLVNCGAYDSCLDLVKAASEKTRASISELTDDHSHLINSILSISKDNKYFRQIRNV